MSARGSFSLRRTSSNVQDKAIVAAMQQRKDLRQPSVTAMMELVGEDPNLMEFSMSQKEEETVASKLKATLPDNMNDALQLGFHFNHTFKPLLLVRDNLDYDADAQDRVQGGNIPVIMDVLINSLRQLRSAPQIRILSALKRFYRAVSTMSRLIRRRNSQRHDMLLNVVNWWETQEVQFRHRLDADMQSPLFRFHHEVIRIIEMKQSLTIPSEVKFGIVKLLYFRQRMSSAKKWHEWREKVKTTLKLMNAFKRTGERNSSGRYPEPIESKIRSLRRSYFEVCNKCPQETSFDPQNITYDRLMDVRNELARVRSAENRSRLLEDFQRALKATKERRKNTFDLMESRREEEYKKRAAERRVQKLAFDDVQRQRQEVMNNSHRGKSRRSSSVVTMRLDGEDGLYHPGDRSTNADPFEVSANNSDVGSPRPRIASGTVSPRTSRGTSFSYNNSRNASVSGGSTDGVTPKASLHQAVSFLDEVPQLPAAARRVSVTHSGTFAAFVAGGTPLDEGFEGSHSGSWGSGGGLRRASSLSRMPSMRRLSESSPLSRRPSETLRVVDLESELVADPLTFLEKFGTAAYEQTLRERERKLREELAASGLDEERQCVQALIMRRNLTPTPALEPFFLSYQGSGSAHHIPDSNGMTAKPTPRLAGKLGLLKAPHTAPHDSSVLSLSSDGDSDGEGDGGGEGPGGWFKKRAVDDSIRIHMPSTSGVRLRQYPSIVRKEGLDDTMEIGRCGLPGPRSASSFSVTRLRRPGQRSTRLDVTSPSVISTSQPAGMLSETSLFRQATPTLIAVINPWATKLANGSTETLKQATLAYAASMEGSKGKARAPRALTPNHLSHSQTTHEPSRVAAPLSPYQSAVAMVKEGHVVLTGEDRDPVQALLRPKAIDSTAAREQVRKERDHSVWVSPPLVGHSQLKKAATSVGVPTKALSAQLTTPQNVPSLKGAPPPRQQQPASFLTASSHGKQNASVAYQQKLQSMLAAAGSI